LVRSRGMHGRGTGHRRRNPGGSRPQPGSDRRIPRTAPREGNMSTGDAVLLDARDVVAGYLPGVDILNGCSLEVHEGEIVGIIGPNGAGKSTLVKAIFGLVPLRRGSVHLRADDITVRPPHELVRRGVGYVPQLHNVFPALTVDDNLRMGCFLRPH